MDWLGLEIRFFYALDYSPHAPWRCHHRSIGAAKCNKWSQAKIPNTSIKWEAMITVIRNSIFLRLNIAFGRDRNNAKWPLGNLLLCMCICYQSDNRSQLSVFFFYVLFRWFFCVRFAQEWNKNRANE